MTGKVTAVLRKTGQTLVDLGNGRSAVLDRAGGAIGQLVTIDVGNGRVVGAPTGSSLIGVSALTPTQLAQVTVANPATPVGQVATIANAATGALTGGNPVGSVAGVAGAVTGALSGGSTGASGSLAATVTTPVANAATGATAAVTAPLATTPVAILPSVVTGVTTVATTPLVTPIVTLPAAVPGKLDKLGPPKG